MTEEQAQSLFDSLLGILRERSGRDASEGSTGLLREIEEEIAAGKAVQVKLQVRGEKVVDDPIAGQRTAEASGSGEFVQRQEFSSVEKLEILINGVALAYLAPARMAQTIFHNVTAFTDVSELDKAMYVSELTQETQWTVSSKNIEETILATAQLSEALTAISKELEKAKVPVSSRGMRK